MALLKADDCCSCGFKGVAQHYIVMILVAMQICSGLSCFNHAFKRFWGQSYCGAVRQLKRHCKLPCLWCRCISSTKHLAVCKLEGHFHSHWWCSQKLPVFERPNYPNFNVSLPNVKGEAGRQRAHGPARRAHAPASGPSRAGEF